MPRRLGEQIKVRLYADHIEVWYAQKKVDSFPRIRGEGKHKINYSHIIEWLVRRPESNPAPHDGRFSAGFDVES